MQWRDRRRLAKTRARAIENSGGNHKKRRLYRELIAATRATLTTLREAAERLADTAGMAAERWRGRVGRPAVDRAHPHPERAAGRTACQ